MSNENKQPDERADAAFLRKSDERHVETFRHRDYACIIEQQEIAAVVCYINALEARATQQATKGDERAALAQELFDALNAFKKIGQDFLGWHSKYAGAIESANDVLVRAEKVMR